MPTPDTFCGSCGQPVIGEHPSGETAERRPCPTCGSLTRRFALEAHAFAHATTTAELSVTTYPQALLSTANDLLQRGQFGISVVVAHMACEVATERAMSKSFQLKRIAYLEDPVLGFLNGYNLANNRNRLLYTALTGDEVQQQQFWPAFKDSATKRNEIMHQSRIVGQSEAHASLAAAKALIAHISK